MILCWCLFHILAWHSSLELNSSSTFRVGVHHFVCHSPGPSPSFPQESQVLVVIYHLTRSRLLSFLHDARIGNQSTESQPWYLSSFSLFVLLFSVSFPYLCLHLPFYLCLILALAPALCLSLYQRGYRRHSLIS